MTEFYLARRYLFRGKAKHLAFIGIISCIGVALGVGTLIVVISVMNGFDRDLMERLLKFNYHLTVEAPNQETLDEIKEKVRSWDEVKSAANFVHTQVFADFDDTIQPLVVKGIDFSDQYERDFFAKHIVEQYGTQGFFLGQGLLRRFIIDEELEYYPLEKKLKLKKAPVAGFFEVGFHDIDNNYALCDVEFARSISPNYVSYLGLRIDEPFKADLIEKRIKKLYPRGVYINTWMESNSVLFSALQLEKFTMFIILSLIVLVASFNIFATLTVKVVEKTKDIGVLKSLGFTSSKVLAIFSLQGLLLGFIGVFTGCGLGVGLCLLLEKYSFIKLPAEIYALDYLPVALNFRDIGLVAVLGLLLSFFSSLAPALRASKLVPCEALRYE